MLFSAALSLSTLAQKPPATDAYILQATEKISPKCISWRRDIHAHPELGNRETRTAGIIAAHLKALGLEPRQLMRKQEAPYKELGLADPKLSRAELIKAMVQHPILIERPILTKGAKAALGRPPEQVLSIL